MGGWTAVAVLVVAGLVGPGGYGAWAEPLAIRVGWVVAPGHVAPLIAALGRREPEILKHSGKSYTTRLLQFQGSSPQIQAQAIGDIDIAALSTAALALAITRANLDVRVVADVIADGHPGYFSESFVVRADGPIQKIEDLKGRRVATNAIGSAHDLAMRTMLRKHGLKDSDFTSVETNFAAMPAMLESGKVDMIGVLPQFADGMIGAPKYRVLFTGRDAVGTTQAVMWAMRAEFIAKHRPALIDFFEDHIRGVRWLIDPKNHAAAVALAAEVTELPKDKLKFAFTRNDFYHSPDARPELNSVQREIDRAAKLGVLPKAVEIRPKYVDLSLVEEAKRRIDGK